MNMLLSNSLLQLLASSAAAGESNPDILTYPDWMLGLMTGGLGLVAVWIFRRTQQPAPLRLNNSPGRINVLTPLHLLAPFFTAFLLMGAAFSLLNSLGIAGIPSQLIPSIVEKLAIIALSILVAHFSFNLGCRRGLGLSVRRWKTDSIRGIMTGVAALPICLLVHALVLTVAAWCGAGQPTPHSMLSIFGDGGTAVYWRLMVVLTAVVLAPLAEELFFRGLAQSMVRRYTRLPWFGILATSVLFTVCHWPHWQTFPSLLILAVLLGYNYERTGRLLPSIVAHAVFNGLQLLSLL